MYFKKYNARSYSVNSRFPKTLKLYRQSWGKMSNVFRTTYEAQFTLRKALKINDERTEAAIAHALSVKLI